MRLFSLFFVLLLVEQSLCLVCQGEKIYNGSKVWVPAETVDSKIRNDSGEVCTVVFHSYTCNIELSSGKKDKFTNINDCIASEEGDVHCKCDPLRCLPTKEMLGKALSVESKYKKSCETEHRALDLSKMPDYTQVKGKAISCISHKSYMIDESLSWKIMDDDGVPEDPSAKNFMRCDILLGHLVGLIGEKRYSPLESNKCYETRPSGYACSCTTDMCHKDIKGMMSKAAEHGFFPSLMKVDELHALLNPPPPPASNDGRRTMVSHLVFSTFFLVFVI